ncbi:MAG: hypothetical protein AYP45_08230 [Candidatus Brocadia carolinensis]|uniref:Uncharacterized protein n=1 Tax=Candidatus Brocadia carolinensis TaxID=1004156 RepID=A0A1V4ATX1_9BACT|nr:MAG: hypothetical protein AYP45_08230 [Candidatus Brocadia caroliniensis]
MLPICSRDVCKFTFRSWLNLELCLPHLLMLFILAKNEMIHSHAGAQKVSVCYERMIEIA